MNKIKKKKKKRKEKKGREQYAVRTASLLNYKGKIVGVDYKYKLSYKQYKWWYNQNISILAVT